MDAWTYDARFLMGVLACLFRPAGWRNPYAKKER